MRVERLEHILRKQTVVNSGILVLVQLWQLVLANVHHVAGGLVSHWRALRCVHESVGWKEQ
jgi:hypothetical protein